MNKDEINNMNIDIIMKDPMFVELALKVMSMKQDINEDYLVPFESDEEDEDTGIKIVKTRQGDYGQMISYVPSRYIKKRVDLAFNQKWSFFIVAERRETEPFQRWSKQEEDYVDGSNYLRCIGMMVVPGLGIRMEYGVKKVFGDAESSDWKACKTDAFKKCAEAFGIYLNYEDNEESEEGSNGYRKSKIDLSNVEYTDEDLDDAFDCEIKFGKYKGSTLKEILDEDDDISYIEWLAENANDDDIKFFANVILRYNKEQEDEKTSHRRNKSKNSSKQSKRENFMNKPEDDYSNKKHSDKSRNRNSRNSDEDDEKEELIGICRDELDNYDRVQAKSMLASVTVSNKYPKGKSKLEQFTLAELRELAEVLEVS